MDIKSEESIRIVVINISNVLGASVYDEAVLPISQATEFVSKYVDMKKYRVVTI